MAGEVRRFVETLQLRICSTLEEIEKRQKFVHDAWQHHEGGGGRTMILQDGEVFEKTGVNTSAVWGRLSEAMAANMNVQPMSFFATGISLVIHPRSPMVPTVHMNYRYFELENGDAWFGGGSDLTPCYLFDEDVIHFHTTLKRACDAHDTGFYPRFKKWCDEYFFVKHRGEARGVGGIFFDYLRGDPAKHFAFIQSAGNAFLDSYLPIVRRRIAEPWGEKEKEWQLIRRGRYVEFNLVYDRGTAFGLESRGRTESILMSLPPVVHWRYNMQPQPDSREGLLVEVLKSPREWVT